MMPNNLIVAVDILSNLLHENKIDFIVLNGLSLARLNSEPTSCMEDVIDFYVFSKDREKALTLLKEHVQISEDNSDSYRKRIGIHVLLQKKLSKGGDLLSFVSLLWMVANGQVIDSCISPMAY